MYRLLEKIPPVRNLLWTKTRRQFLLSQAQKGVMLKDIEVPGSLASLKSLLLDAKLVMEGQNVVRLVAAPLEIVKPDRFKRQGAWMMLTAGVALGCDGFAPLAGFAREMGFENERMARQYPRVETLAYDADRRIETTVHKDAGGFRAYAKGDTRAILERCTQVINGKETLMVEAEKQRAQDIADDMEACGLQTLAFATKWLPEAGAFEERMSFLGIVGMGDLPRPGMSRVMEALRALSVRPLLLAEEALPEGAVRQSGAVREGAGVLYAPEIDAMNIETLREAVCCADAFLGVSAEQRGRLLRALRADGPVASVCLSPEGTATLSLGRGEGPDAAVPGGLEGVLGLLKDCQRMIADNQTA